MRLEPAFSKRTRVSNSSISAGSFGTGFSGDFSWIFEGVFSEVFWLAFWAWCGLAATALITVSAAAKGTRREKCPNVFTVGTKEV